MVLVIQQLQPVVNVNVVIVLPRGGATAYGSSFVLSLRQTDVKTSVLRRTLKGES